MRRIPHLVSLHLPKYKQDWATLQSVRCPVFLVRANLKFLPSNSDTQDWSEVPAEADAALESSCDSSEDSSCGSADSECSATSPDAIACSTAVSCAFTW